MSLSKERSFALSVIVGLMLLGLAGLGVWLTPEVSPVSAETWATPQGAAFGGGEWSMVPYINAGSVLTPVGLKYCGNGFQTAAYVLGDFQQIVDQTSGAQAITCTLEFSNDNSNWCTQMSTMTAVTTDTSGVCNVLHLFGRYSRVCCLNSAVDRYTITVRAKVYN